MDMIHESVQKLCEYEEWSVGEQQIAEKYASDILKDVEALGQKENDYDIASILHRVRQALDNILKPQQDKWADEL